MIKVDIRVGPAIVIGEAGDHQGIGQFTGFRYPHTLAVQISTAAFRRREQFIAHWVESNRYYQFTGFLSGQGDAPDRIPVGKITGAVQRVHIPAEFRLRRVAAAFFRHNAVAGEAGAQSFHHQLFRSFVGFGYQIKIGFEFERDFALEVVAEQGTGGQGDVDRRVQIGKRHFSRLHTGT